MANQSHRGAHPAAARRAITLHPYCAWCNATSDLAADHIVPGKPRFGYQVLCRPCNSRRSHGHTGPKR